MDNRKFHWNFKNPRNEQIKDREITKKIIVYVTMFAIRLQVAIIYFHSTVAKLFNEEWVNGTAVYYYMLDPLLGLPEFLLKVFNPIFTSWLIVLPTWGTLLIQTVLFAALFAPKRIWKYILIFSLLFHETIALMLGLVSFSIIMSAALILYLRPINEHFNGIEDFWKKLVRFIERKKQSGDDDDFSLGCDSATIKNNNT